MTQKSRIATVVCLLVFAAMVGIIVISGEELIFAAALGRPFRVDEADALAMSAVLTAIPFLFLAFFQPRLVPWLVAIAITVALHGWWLAQGIAYQLAPTGGGVPIFGALIMLFAPFVILIVAGIVNGVVSRRERSAPVATAA